MDKKKKQYHHGDLRSTLLETTAKIIVEEGVEKVTMRTLSQRVGVSRTAPYRHFPDKTALLCAIAEDGFKRLKNRLQLITQDTSTDALSRFENMALAYVDFAVRNSAYYRLMFGKEVVGQSPPAKLQAAARAAFDEAMIVIEACQKENLVKGDDPLALANVVWATVHGLSTLLINEQIQTGDRGYGLHTLLADEGVQTSSNVHPLVQLAIKILIDGVRTDVGDSSQ